MQTRHVSTAPTVVGYTSYQTESNESPAFGPTFIPVNGADGIKMKDLKPVDFDPDQDLLQKLDPNTTEAIGYFAYVSPEIAEMLVEILGGKAEDYIGWWDTFNGSYGDPAYYMGDEDVKVGDAFLGLMGSFMDVGFTFSGEVPQESLSVFTDSNESPFFANFLPRAIPMRWITCVDFDPDQDLLQKLDPNTTEAIGYFAYVSPEIAEMLVEILGGKAEDYIGWWDTFNGAYGDPEFYMGDEIINPGDAFLGLMGSFMDVEIKFPSALKTED